MNRRRSWMLPIMAGLVITCDAGRAQELFSPEMGYVRSVAAPREASGSASWQWVHTGVAVQVAGSFGDWATRWKQPEGNSWMAEPGGRYGGTFYRSGTVHKATLSAGLAAVSYAVAWKWPKTRKYVGIFNIAYSGARRTAFRGEAEQHSGRKANTDSGLKPNTFWLTPECCSACARNVSTGRRRWTSTPGKGPFQ